MRSPTGKPGQPECVSFYGCLNLQVCLQKDRRRGLNVPNKRGSLNPGYLCSAATVLVFVFVFAPLPAFLRAASLVRLLALHRQSLALYAW